MKTIQSINRWAFEYPAQKYLFLSKHMGNRGHPKNVRNKEHTRKKKLALVVFLSLIKITTLL